MIYEEKEAAAGAGGEVGEEEEAAGSPYVTVASVGHGSSSFGKRVE